MPKRKQTERKKSESGNGRLKQAPVRTIQRSQINPAPYNPRVISEYALKQLESSLSRFGLVETLVWNESTGNLVSGHQRLKLLDKACGYPEKCTEYDLAVSVVALSLKREQELNVKLNNQALQGHFDQDLFFNLIKDSEHTLESLGMTRIDLEAEFGASPSLDSFFAQEAQATAGVKDSIEAIKDRKKDYRQDDNASADQDADYYLMLCFESSADKDAWLRANNFPVQTKFISAAELMLARADVFGAQAGVIQQAVQRVREMEQDPEIKMGRALELVAADFLAGA